MNKILSIIKNGFKSPRFHIESRQFKYKELILITLIPIILMTIANYRLIAPTFNGIFNQIEKSIDNIPDFNYENEELHLYDNNKPLYYHSDDIQIVIDPTIESNRIFNTIPISKEQLSRIDNEKLVSLYLFKEQAFIGLNKKPYEIQQPYATIQDKNQLIRNMRDIINSKGLSILILVLIIFIFSILSYWLIMLIYGLLTSFMNRFLNQKIKLSERIKILITLTFVPLTIFECARVVMPHLSFPFVFFGLLILYLYFVAFKQQTQIVTYLQSNFSLNKIETKIDWNNIEEEKIKQQKRIDLLQKLKDEFIVVYKQYKLSDDTFEKKNLDKKLKKLQAEIIQLDFTIQNIQKQFDDKKIK